MDKATHYTEAELAEAERADQMRDYAHAMHQAEIGPFFPEKGITRESLLAYAAECLEKALPVKVRS